MTETAMFDFSDYYDRIAEQLPNDCRIVEVGVANGDSALHLAKRLRQIGKNDFTLYMVDDMSYGWKDQIVTIYENIIAANLTNHNIKVIPYDSVEASLLFNNDSLDFCFIDTSHLYPETCDSIKSWYGKLKDGGILAGHDYFTAPPVKKAVDELLPLMIKRQTIDDKETEQYQEFEPEQFLRTYETANGYGIWEVPKRFYWKPR